MVRQFFRIIGSQTDHMRELSSDLLDVARIETEVLRVAQEPSQAPALVEVARNNLLSGGDRLHIVQALDNLLFYATLRSGETSVIRLSALRQGLSMAV